jgi:hypothetical protein
VRWCKWSLGPKVHGVDYAANTLAKLPARCARRAFNQAVAFEQKRRCRLVEQLIVL